MNLFKINKSNKILNDNTKIKMSFKYYNNYFIIYN